MLGGFSVHSGKKLDEIFSKCRQRKAKDKENVKSPVTTSTQASTPRDLIFALAPQVTRAYATGLKLIYEGSFN